MPLHDIIVPMCPVWPIGLQSCRRDRSHIYILYYIIGDGSYTIVAVQRAGDLQC